MVVTTVWPLPYPHFLQKTATPSTYAKQTRGSFEPTSEVPFTWLPWLTSLNERSTDSQEPNLSFEGISKILWIFLFCFKISTNYGPPYYKVNCDLQIRGTSTCHRPPFQNSGSSKTCFWMMHFCHIPQEPTGVSNLVFFNYIFVAREANLI